MFTGRGGSKKQRGACAMRRGYVSSELKNGRMVDDSLSFPIATLGILHVERYWGIHGHGYMTPDFISFDSMYHITCCYVYPTDDNGFKVQGYYALTISLLMHIHITGTFLQLKSCTLFV